MSSIHRSGNLPVDFERIYWKAMNRVPRRFIRTKMALKQRSKQQWHDETPVNKCFYITPFMFFVTFVIAGIFLSNCADIHCPTSEEESQWSYALDNFCSSQFPQVGIMLENATLPLKERPNADENNPQTSVCLWRVFSWLCDDNSENFLVLLLEVGLFTIGAIFLREVTSINNENLEEEQFAEGRVIRLTFHFIQANKIMLRRNYVSSHYMKNIIKYLGLRTVSDILCCATILGHIIFLDWCFGFMIWNPELTDGILAVFLNNFMCKLNGTFVGNARAEVMCFLPKNIFKSAVSIFLWIWLLALMIAYIFQSIITILYIIRLLLLAKKRKKYNTVPKTSDVANYNLYVI